MIAARKRAKGFEVAKQPANGRSPKAKANQVEDAQVVTGAAPADSPATTAKAATAMPPPTVTKAEAPAAPQPRATSQPDPEPVPEKPATPVKEPVTLNASQAASLPHEPPAPERRGGFFPLLLGGLVAGAIGYAVAWWQFGQQAQFDSTAIEAEIADLRTQVANIPAPVFDTAALDQGLADTQTGLADVQAGLTAVQERVATLESQAGQAPAIGAEAQQRAVEQLSGEIAQQQAALEQQRADLQAQLDATRTEAETIRQTAVDTARAETARAALARVQGAVESGAPMQAALTDLSNALTGPVPDALTAVAEGTPTLANLRDTFPEASRAALNAARSAGEAGESAGRLTAFLRNQLDVRSVTPREGGSVDAILSRAEDALRGGRLNDALAEIATLPESARTAMSDWTAQAEARAAAVDAADQLDASLTAN